MERAMTPLEIACDAATSGVANDGDVTDFTGAAFLVGTQKAEPRSGRSSNRCGKSRSVARG